MTFSALLPLPVFKEVRALAVPWLACLFCMVVPAFVDAPRALGGISVPAYFLGAAALGALSIGHEYTDRTLSLLLSLPARRERFLAVKLGVLAAMLLTLWVVAYTLVFGDARLPQAARHAASLLPVLCGLFLAPWLTMACRNPIGGTVFTLAVPGVLLVIGELIGVAKYGHGSLMEAFRLWFVWASTLSLCAIGAAAGWWTFIRLEAIEGPGQDVRLPLWLRPRRLASATVPQLTKRHPLWLLVTKELRLQQLPLVLVALYVVGWLAAAWLTTLVSDSAYQIQNTFAALTLPYAVFLPILIGSSASAAERQMGTLEWQVLLPIAAWKQWAAKASVVMGLSMVLALGLPTVLLYLSGIARVIPPGTLSTPPYAVAIVALLSTGSLYVSSLCRSGLRALVMSLPVMLAAMMFLQLAIEWVGIASYRAAARWAGGIAPAGAGISRFARPRILEPDMVTPLLIAGFIAVLLRFALANHRAADRPAGRVWTQVIVMSAFVTAGVITLAVMQAVHR